MSYVIKAVLSNPRCPECGQITIPFPIPVDQYDQTIEMLRAMGLGEPVDQDCKVDVIDSHYSVLEITPKRGLAERKNPEYLYLPAAEHQIERTLLRVGITAPHNAQVQLDSDELPKKVSKALDLDHLSGDDIPVLNRICQAMQSLTEADMEKLNAVVCMAEPGGMMAIRRLVENLDQFDFIPGIHTQEEYGRHMIRESGHFDYDENLEGFYDYRRYGEQHIRQEGGQFNECSYVVYQGVVPLEDLMRDISSEQHQGPQMGGFC